MMKRQKMKKNLGQVSLALNIQIKLGVLFILRHVNHFCMSRKIYSKTSRATPFPCFVSFSF